MNKRFCAWNVRIMYRAGSLKTVAKNIGYWWEIQKERDH
jgi:hypothetical protein